jgi:hypothetical protein
MGRTEPREPRTTRLGCYCLRFLGEIVYTISPVLQIQSGERTEASGSKSLQAIVVGIGCANVGLITIRKGGAGLGPGLALSQLGFGRGSRGSVYEF